MSAPDAAPETIPIRPAHRFDEAALGAHLARHIAGFEGPLTVRQFQGGQSNPTFHLSTASREYVMRKKPPGKLLPSAHAVDREFRVISALKPEGIPVATAHLLCEDASVIGTAFYIMDYVRGRVFRDPLLPGIEPKERSAIYDAMNDVLARLHMVNWQAAELADFGKPGNYYSRQISRWAQQYEAAKTDQIDAMDELARWLPAHVPAGDEASVVHGDYRLENMIFHASEPRVLAVIDWELSTLGHPLGDLAYNCLPYRMAGEGRGPLRNLDPALGIPSEAEYLAAYCRRTGRSGIPDWSFYLAFSLFRSAGIVQGVYKRGLMGNASNREAATSYAAVPRLLAEQAWDLVRRA
ncbi:MAG TPA: phosphotransferase [Candidatus Cybelea sp.]|nr:phosphotransferase [Candidatus Cybelea sp.]